MGGKGSGRQALPYEIMRRNVIHKAWRITDEVIDSRTPDGKPCKESVEIAGQIAVKDMIQKESVEHQLSIRPEDRLILDKYMNSNKIENKT